MTIFSSRSYLQRQRFLPRQIESAPAPSLKLIVVLPAKAEAQLTQSLATLINCASPAPKIQVEVLVGINASAHEEAAVHTQNAHSLLAARPYSQQKQAPFLQIHLLHFPELPPKKAGVGLIRKILMDEAVDRFEQLAEAEGIIVSLDADTLVQPNYLKEIYHFFQQRPRIDACTIAFAHPLTGMEYSSSQYQAITFYELYMRYYVQALRSIGYPHAYHCLGSAFAVRAKAYQSEGGMNRRKAQEALYFLQKFMFLGTLGKLSTTQVVPSPRISTRVALGTGMAVKKYLENPDPTYPVFSLQSFQDLAPFLQALPQWYHTQRLLPLSEAIDTFLQTQAVEEQLQAMLPHVNSEESFQKRALHWFSPLKVLQYLNHARDLYYGTRPLVEQAYQLASGRTQDLGPLSPKNLLEYYRQWQRE